MKTTVIDIPIRRVLGEPPTHAIRRWQADSDPYPIGSEPPAFPRSSAEEGTTTEQQDEGTTEKSQLESSASRDATVCGVAHEDVPTLPCTLPPRHGGRHEAWGANVLLGWWPQTEREHYYRGWNDCMDWMESVDAERRHA